MKLAPFALALFLSSTASAGELHVQLHGLSYHFQKRIVGDWNQVNPGLGLRYSFTDTWSVQGGAYKNSHSMPTKSFYSLYLGTDWTPVHINRFHSGFFFGIVTGYDLYYYSKNGNGENIPVVTKRIVRPAGGLVSRFQAERVNLTLRLAPKMEANGSLVVAAEIGYRFD